MFVLMRAVTYAAVFIGFVLIFLPAQLLAWSGITRPQTIGIPQVTGTAIVLLGGSIALWCVFTFALIGKGTPAPFDPPRRLVTRGPYRVVRNPMYIGAALALGGATVFFESIVLLGFTVLFLLVTHMFVVVYEERVLRRMFGEEYEGYVRQVGRWWPKGT